MATLTLAKRRWGTVTATGALLLLFLAAPATGQAYDATFNGGGLFGLTVDEAFTQGTFQSLSYSYEYCGNDPLELTCEWEVRAVLYSNPATRCSPSTPEATVLWDSGPQSGNGSVDSGPLSFVLEGCPGQVLTVSSETHSTFEPGEGGWHVIAQGSSATLTSITFGAHWIEEAEGVVSVANPWAMPTPLPTRMPFSVSPDCRSLMIGNMTYVFSFRQIGCRKAANIATMMYLSGASPNGYRCGDRPAGGTRCQRRGHPKKYVEWHPPRNPGSR